MTAEPAARLLEATRREAAKCRNCDLWRLGTQTVFGEGPVPASLMLVGEQPGDREDLAGLPFVGPAGGLLDDALAEAGIERGDAYLTNVVKHFKWRHEGGKRRIHDKPNRTEVRACLPWFHGELGLVRPKVLVCLGATAAQALLGPGFRISADHGVPVPAPNLAPVVLATTHPSAVLRAGKRRGEVYAQLIADLRVAASALDG